MIRRKIKKNYLALIVGLICFIIPFFWFKNGEVDYGGDSTRLYFYDPLSWLKNVALFYVNPLESLGAEHANFSLVPLLSFLALLKTILNNSSYLLNNFFNGLLLSGTFLTLNFLILEFLKNENSDEKKIAAGIGSLFFVFSPLLIYDWERALYSQYQILAYPLFALFFLKYLNSGEKKYLILLPFITFLFAVNFSFWSAPWFFAFFSFFFLFLFFISLQQRKLLRFFKGLMIVIGLFLLVNSFEISSQSLNLFGLSGTNYKAFFGESSASRGIPYFMSIQPHTRLTYSFFNQPQYVITHGYNHPQELNIYSYGIKNLFLFGTYPILICLAIIFRKKGETQEFEKINVLILSFFLLSLFFVTANITDIGKNIYKNLFYLPGFSMFRSYYTKFSLIYVFFYSLLISFSVYRLIGIFKNQLIKKAIILLLLGLIYYNGWPLISGSILNTVLYNSGGIPVPNKIDPEYEQFVEKVRNIGTESRIINFPLTNESYQLLRGENGGVYFGTSSLAVLAGKTDFSGLGSFGIFQPQIEKLIENDNITILERIFNILNIGFIFHNTDNYIYDQFPDYPYSGWLKSVFPTQKAITDFIGKKLSSQKVLAVGSYFLYKRDDVLPRFYTSKEIVFSTNKGDVLSKALSFFEVDPRISYYFCPDQNNNCQTINNYDNVFVKGSNSALVENTLWDNDYLGFGKEIVYPAVKHKSYLLWQLTLINEYRKQYAGYFDKEQYVRSKLFYANKRVNEVTSFGTNSSDELKIYNSLVVEAIDSLSQVKDERIKKILALEIKNNLQSNIERIRQVEIDGQKEWQERILFLVRKNNDNVSPFDLSHRDYTFVLPKSGVYELFYQAGDGKTNQTKELSNFISFETNEGIKTERAIFLSNGWVKAGEASMSQGNNTLRVDFNNMPNLLTNEKWHLVQSLSQDEVPIYNKFTKFVTPEKYYYKKITKWQADSWYALNWENKQPGLGLAIEEEYEENGIKKRILREIPKEKSGQIVFYLKSHSKSVSSKILIFGQSSVKNIFFNPDEQKVSLLPVIEPEIVVKSKNDSTKEKTAPQIKFLRINPTKYLIDVKAADNPYTLVFLNNYHPGWKVYLVKTEPIIETTASYFQDAVLEGRHMNTFLDKYIFETWKKKPIADENHFVVNGYANSWNISPLDVGNQIDYQLIIEFVPQRVFYISLTISLLTLFLLFSFLAKMTLHKKSI